jgi:hypothetical protein
MYDELRLATGALKRHNGSSRNFRCYLGAEVASHQVKAEVKTCRRAG